ncbi:MAG: glycosyl transferase [Candidatus Schekmanbacteria bacterium RBG_16_38_10]|uniref:Glycosyl transferase n=1 Tax=Candidatus Schekmanbacteria bacterium RBG_16_38_10 TaxID=1817879 RepID=A0A1F7RPG3_9BACT|nr:MAG: glycosyl transferase [Candidatus Schekmanbacteria bacterium RBG_16_38_10]
MVKIVFWFSIIFIFYTYIGYPLILMILSLFRNRSLKKGDFTPDVTFIIAAYNEERRIKEKIENTVKQDYPREKLEIIVASDCSTDKTDDILKSYESYGIRVIRSPERKGKDAAQMLAVKNASGEILVFSDVATILPPNGITNIVRNFFDPTVGCVSSLDRFIDPGRKISGEGVYVRYEMFLRTLESEINTLVGLSGSFFAARRKVCQDWAVDLQSDFNTLLKSVKMGLRGVLDPDSIGYYKNIIDERREFERKARTVLRGIYVFMKSLAMLNPFQYGLFSWQLFSHKLCRWLIPFAMILAFFSNVFLVFLSSFYLYTFLLQSVFYAIAFGGMWSHIYSKENILRIPSFLVLVNLSILNAWYQYARGTRIVSWNPSKR